MVHPSANVVREKRDTDADTDAQRSRLTCDDAPFIPQCRVKRAIGNQCLSGSFTTTLTGGTIVIGKVYEARNKLRRDSFFREIEVNGVRFQLRNGDGFDTEGTFPALQHGDEFPLDVIQAGAVGKFTGSIQGEICRVGYF